jgi:hypothetical protein
MNISVVEVTSITNNMNISVVEVILWAFYYPLKNKTPMGALSAKI